MKVLKNFTDGIVFLLALFILIYTVTLYVKFKPDEEKIQEGESKVVLFLEDSQTNKNCLRLFFVLFVSGIAGFLFRRKPEFSSLFAVFTLCFILMMFDFNMIPKRPMVIISFVAAHTAGTLAYCADHDKIHGSSSCPNSGLIGGVGALVLSLNAISFQLSAIKSASSIEFLEENSVSFPENLRFYPQLAELIKKKLLVDGRFEAEEAVMRFSSELRFETIKSHFLETVDENQYSIYLRLVILIFAALILCFALRKKSPWLAAVISFIPFLFCALELTRDGLSTLPLPIMICTLY